ncbi:hypothetical protein X474_16730 [Dethiosulfatarculus sandiegensis]|uniref:Uncharacterized protein n=1 Tax=Dethiosulfatarculus sandiegensis TaxID=1429043 RepID=A0A0D2J481_9BACT|nr:hypothetical protein X474_16730 [Dethiosulfatarculus sandiegensis]
MPSEKVQKDFVSKLENRQLRKQLPVFYCLKWFFRIQP